MADIEKLKFYANAKRAAAIQIHKVESGYFVPHWIGRLNGKNVTMNVDWKHKTRDQAVEDARRFRESCRNELQGLEGLHSSSTVRRSSNS